MQHSNKKIAILEPASHPRANIPGLFHLGSDNPPSSTVWGPIKRWRRWRWLLFLPLLLTAFLMYFVNFDNDLFYERHFTHTVVGLSPGEESSASFLVDTSGCRIPALDPMDPMVRRFVWMEKPVNCSSRPPLVESNDSFLWVRHDVFEAYNATEEEISCHYCPLWRPDGDLNNSFYGVDNVVKISANCSWLDTSTPTQMQDEFVQVTCRTHGRNMYRDYFAFVPPREPRAPELLPPDRDAVSVMIVGVDTVSRLNLHRQMKSTVEEMRRLGAIEMLGYNNVGDNTFMNLLAVLAGLTEQELRATCWPQNKAPFDDCPWMWKEFAKRGYVSAFAEDSPQMGIFNFLKVGFVHRPTDYYARPFFYQAEKDVGHERRKYAKLCLGARTINQVLLDYIRRFACATAPRRPSFALFWTGSLTHDFLNLPSAGDALYANLLRRMESCGALNRRVLLLASDHGIRWGPFRETAQGRLEERLPFLFVIMPPWFQERYTAAAANLRRNARRLTTPFDLHSQDLTSPSTMLSQEAIRARSLAVRNATQTPRGLSLFLHHPEDRTCASAGVESHWCTCQRTTQLSRDSADALAAAAFLVRRVNEMLRPYRQCAQLSLAEVRGAQRKATQDDGPGDVVVTVRTTPGNALFEATVRRRSDNDTLALAGLVSRINTYGSQSSCVADFHLRLYCFCL